MVPQGTPAETRRQQRNAACRASLGRAFLWTTLSLCGAHLTVLLLALWYALTPEATGTVGRTKLYADLVLSGTLQATVAAIVGAVALDYFLSIDGQELSRLKTLIFFVLLPLATVGAGVVVAIGAHQQAFEAQKLGMFEWCSSALAFLYALTGKWYTYYSEEAAAARRAAKSP